jgi:hypothetical protein
MATHTIQMNIPSRVVLNSDIEFDVHSNESKLGTLRISKGSIEWAPAHFAHGFHMEWEKFDHLMRQEGRH